MKRTHHPSVKFLPKCIRKHQESQNWDSFYKIIGLWSSKNIKVIKVKERLGNCTLVKKIKEVLQLNVTGDFELDSKWCMQVAQLPKPEWGAVMISWFSGYILVMSFPGAISDFLKKTHLPKQETQQTWFDRLVGKIPWSRKWQPIPVFLPGKFHGQRSLAGYSPLGHKSGTWLSNWAHCDCIWKYPCL